MANKGRPVYTVLTSKTGDVDLYVQLQENSNLVEKDQWVLPTDREYM